MKVAILNNGEDGQKGWERHFQTAIITIIVGLLSWTLLSVLDIRERITKFEERLSTLQTQVQTGTGDRFRASDWRIQKERLDERAAAHRKELDEHHEMISTGYANITPWRCPRDIEEEELAQRVLLNSIKKRMEYPELKALVLEEYREWQAGSLIVEKKSSGSVLYQEMRRMGVPIQEFTPGKGQDKISRVNAVSTLFHGGIVWAPHRRWAQEVIGV